MRHLLTGEDLFAQILMLRTADDRAIIVAEGPTDCSVLDIHLNLAECQSLPANGKTAVLHVIELIEQARIEKVLGIVDQDFDAALGTARRSSALVYVDAHDLDTLIFYSPSVANRVCRSFSSGTEQDQDVAAKDADLELVERLAWPVSALRFLSVRDRLQLNLDRFPVHEIVAGASATPDTERLINLALQRSPNAGPVDRAALMRSLQSVIAGSDPRLTISGHDLHGALTVLIKSYWGGPSSATADVVARAMRAAFSCTQLIATQLYADVRAWGERRGLNLWTCPNCP